MPVLLGVRKLATLIEYFDRIVALVRLDVQC